MEMSMGNHHYTYRKHSLIRIAVVSSKIFGASTQTIMQKGLPITGNMTTRFLGGFGSL